MLNARNNFPLYGLASIGRPCASSLKPSTSGRLSMPRWSSNEWFSIIMTTMFVIFGSVSVPTGSVGFGRLPGLRTGPGIDVVVAGAVVGGFGADDLLDEEQPASSAATR